MNSAQVEVDGDLLFPVFLDKPIDDGPGIVVFFEAFGFFGILGRCGLRRWWDLLRERRGARCRDRLISRGQPVHLIVIQWLRDHRRQIGCRWLRIRWEG